MFLKSFAWIAGAAVSAQSLFVLSLAIGADFTLIALFVTWLRADTRLRRSADASAELGSTMVVEPSSERLEYFGLGHEAPLEPCDVDAAHRIMQVHRSCRLDSCASKREAFETLVDAGKLVPDARAERQLHRI
ncbi:hypothetical protein ACIBQ0_36200 [Nocardia nova]|uniref:hypothetical protein n=1 Tax=Nocardia nova TaxID=37330 RepID=UPI003790C7DE